MLEKAIASYDKMRKKIEVFNKWSESEKRLPC